MPSSPDILVSFILASAVLLLIPGPTIVMVVSQTLAHGRRIALASVAGVALGDLTAATLSLTGVGTLLAASATGFLVLKTVGAAYLVYVGVTMWRAPAPDFSTLPAADDTSSRLRIFRDAFLVTVFNPKGIIFFMAFVPQFISADEAFAPQAALFVAVFVALGIANAWGYMLLADRARETIRRPKVLRAVTRVGGGLLVGAGLASLFVRRSA